MDEHVLRDNFIQRTVAIAADLDRSDKLTRQKSILIPLRVDQLTGSRDVAKVRCYAFGVAHYGVELINRTTRRADRLRRTNNSGVVVVQVFEDTLGKRDEIS